jgi:hypothetical protein
MMMNGLMEMENGCPWVEDGEKGLLGSCFFLLAFPVWG